MIVEDQAPTVAFLRRPESHGLDGAVEVMETHISVIFLAGARAFKLKRAVRLPYADFSTPALRLAACETEVALNRRTAPSLYRGVRRITRAADGGLAFDGDGATVDAVVEMTRFPQDALFDRMAREGRLDAPLMARLAEEIAAFHAAAPAVGGEGGADVMRGVLDINAAGFATSRVFGDDEVAAFDARFRRALEGHAERLDRRAAAGRLRRCHGDLHLRNICLFEGRPQLFDCIEFNDRIATVDTLYDLAFLLMDLWHRELPAFASLVVNRYLDVTGDEDGFVLLPFFMAVRAAVRAHVTATQADETGDADGRLARTARAYFALAQALLVPGRGCVVAIGGLSGSGKSTVAEALAPHVGPPPGARLYESDRIRKAMHGVASATRLPDAAYGSEVSERVYDALARRSAALAADGVAVVADAVYDRPARRAAVAARAAAAGVAFLGVWLAAPAETLRARVAARAKGPSDATVAVLERQLARDPGADDWLAVDAARPVADSVAAIRAALGEERPEGEGAAAAPAGRRGVS